MKKWFHIVLPFLVMVLLSTNSFGQSGNVGADGKTFSQRRSDWLASIPAPSMNIDFFYRKSYIWGWLENGEYSSPVHETVQQIIDWGKGIHAQNGLLAVMIRKYGDQGNNLMSDSDEQEIKNKYESMINASKTFGSLNPNKKIFSMIGVYIYTQYYDNSLYFPVYGHSIWASAPFPNYMESAWGSFTRNGNTYTFDHGPYHANTLAKDWIEYEIENSYLLANNREFDSLNYGRAFADALIALWGVLDDSDPLKKKAKMTADLLLIDGMMDIGNANSTGGVMGRADYSLMARNPIFPAFIYWGSGNDEFRHDLQALWAIQYEPPAPIIDLGVLTDEDDSYFYFHKEFNNNTLLHREDRGKWNFASKYYNIGSSDGHKNQGWCVVVKGERNKFIRFWINGDEVEPPDNIEGSYLGDRGRQFRNAMFVDLGSQPYYWEKGDASWDTETAESGWLFKKLGKAMVALRLASTTASVELATEGVEYKNWNEFINAVKNNAELTSGYFITSKKERINSNDYCGLNQPGDCAFPFKRIETIDQNGNKIVQWKNKVMTISHKGNSLVYDFNNWVYLSSDTPHDIKPPNPPKDVSVKEPQ